MALLLSECKLNDTFELKEGYARIHQVSYDSLSQQPVYNIIVYNTKEDRENEKKIQGIINKYIFLFQPIISKMTQSVNFQGNPIYNNYTRVLRSPRYVLGTAKDYKGPDDDEYETFFCFVKENKLEKREIYEQDKQDMMKFINIPMQLSIGGNQFQEYLFNNSIIAKAYGEVKVIDAPLFMNSQDI